MSNFNSMLPARYKKCKKIKGLGKDAMDSAKRMHYYRYDFMQSLDALEELILEEKTSDTAIDAKSIEDYNKDRGIRPVLKAVMWNLTNWKKARVEWLKLEKNAGLKPPNMKEIRAIKGDLVKLKKHNKLDKELLKLEKQIDADLQEFESYLKVLKEYKVINMMPDMAFDRAAAAILKAKPKLSSKQKKFNDLSDKKMSERGLKKEQTACEKSLKEIIKQTELAIKAAEKNKFYDVAPFWQAGNKELQTLKVNVKSYADIENKYSAQIKKSDNQKLIMKYIHAIEDVGAEADRTWEAAKEKISKLGDAAKKKAKAEAKNQTGTVDQKQAKQEAMGLKNMEKNVGS